MKAISLISEKIDERLEIIILESWKIFINQFLHKKYEINLEAPFQLHFSAILKSVGELYCINRNDIFLIDLEVNKPINEKNNYIDILISFIDKKTNNEYFVPIELKFTTKRQSAADVRSMDIYKDIYNLETVKKKYSKENILFCYFFLITDYELYIKEGTGLRSLFTLADNSKIIPNKEYKYIDNKTGSDYYNKNGGFIFSEEYIFCWEIGQNIEKQIYYFLKVKI